MGEAGLDVDFASQSGWHAVSAEMEMCTTPAPTFKKGDRVRVKPSVPSPACAWGDVKPGDCGTVTGLDSGGCMGEAGLDVDFASQSGWHAVSAEMELCDSPGFKPCASRPTLGATVTVHSV